MHFSARISTDQPAVGLKISQRPQNPGCPLSHPSAELCHAGCGNALPASSPTITQRWLSQSAAGWRGRGSTRRALGLLFFFFLPLGKMLALGREGRKEANSSLSATAAVLLKQKPKKQFGREKPRVSWVLPLRRWAGGMRGGANVCPGSRVKGLALSCRELLGLHELCKVMPLFTLTPGVFCCCGKCRRFKTGEC